MFLWDVMLGIPESKGCYQKIDKLPHDVSHKLPTEWVSIGKPIIELEEFFAFLLSPIYALCIYISYQYTPTLYSWEDSKDVMSARSTIAILIMILVCEPKVQPLI